jgi:hypothetical protein
MSWNTVRLADVAATPWRNGGGVTRELLAWPDANDWRLRLSVAEVARDGPFSLFEGAQRWFAVLSGAGVRLSVAGEDHVLTAASDAFSFEGAAAVDCALIGGPTQDFNLMARGGAARMERVRGTWSGASSAMSFVAAYSGSAGATAVFGSEKADLAPHTLAWRILDADGPAQLLAQDALWMEIKP